MKRRTEPRSFFFAVYRIREKQKMKNEIKRRKLLLPRSDSLYFLALAVSLFRPSPIVSTSFFYLFFFLSLSFSRIHPRSIVCILDAHTLYPKRIQIRVRVYEDARNAGKMEISRSMISLMSLGLTVIVTWNVIWTHLITRDNGWKSYMKIAIYSGHILLLLRIESIFLKN